MKLDTQKLNIKFVANDTLLTYSGVRNGKIILKYNFNGVEKEVELEMNDLIGYTDF